MVWLSPFAVVTDQKKSRIAGCDDFVAKPVDEKQLLSAISALLKVEWTYEESQSNQQASTQQANDNRSLIAPPVEELECLYELASIGRMSALRKRLTDLEQLNSQYAAFANKVRELARGFEDEEILALIEEHM